MNQLSPKLLPFPTGWYSFGLGPYRPCDATYCLIPYEILSPIDESLFQGTLHWLISSKRDKKLRGMSHFHAEANLLQIIASAQQLSISLPDAFLRLMASTKLMERISSCTDCYFALSEKLVVCPGSEEGYIVRFLNAAQGQIAWYLYLTPQGNHCILVGFPLLDLLHDPESPEYIQERITDEESSMAFAGKGSYVCASSFEEFLYRFWIENILWYKIVWYHGKKPLTEEEEHYLSHYYEH